MKTPYARPQHIVDIGPGAGVHGGRIIAQGTLDDILNSEDSLTGQYLSGRVGIAIPDSLTPVDKDKQITIRNAHGNNLKNVDISFPVGLLTCVTGVSGSGKSTLVNDTLYAYAARLINRAGIIPAPCDAMEGLEHFDKVVDIDQSPIGRTPRSNPATYTGLFTPIRELFSATPEARSRGYTPGRFSFNVKGGAAKPVKEMASLKWKCTFCPIFSFIVMHATVNAITGKPWKYAIKAKRLIKCWI